MNSKRKNEIIAEIKLCQEKLGITKDVYKGLKNRISKGLHDPIDGGSKLRIAEQMIQEQESRLGCLHKEYATLCAQIVQSPVMRTLKAVPNE